MFWSLKFLAMEVEKREREVGHVGGGKGGIMVLNEIKFPLIFYKRWLNNNNTSVCIWLSHIFKKNTTTISTHAFIRVSILLFLLFVLFRPEYYTGTDTP